MDAGAGSYAHYTEVATGVGSCSIIDVRFSREGDFGIGIITVFRESRVQRHTKKAVTTQTLTTAAIETGSIFLTFCVHPESLSRVETKMDAMTVPEVGARRRTRRSKGPSAKALSRVLKSHGLKSSGKKATLRARAKKAHLLSKA